MSGHPGGICFIVQMFVVFGTTPHPFAQCAAFARSRHRRASFVVGTTFVTNEDGAAAILMPFSLAAMLYK